MEFTNEISDEKFRKLIEPNLRLFLSVDVVGSTKFKFDKRGAGQIWLNFFVSFFTEFSTHFGNAQLELIKGGLEKPQHEAVLWKSQGDELIFVVELKCENEAAFFVSAFRDVLGKYHKRKTVVVDDESQIDFKGTAWLAGFPVGNAAIPIQSNPSNPTIEEFDFIGPLIDVGFRLSRFSSARRFTVSVDLAYLLANCIGSTLEFYYGGRIVLKGVLDGSQYPIVWIAVEAPCKNQCEELESKSEMVTALEPCKLKQFCGSFIENTGEPLRLPFIASVSQTDHPVWFTAAIADIEQELRRVFHVLPPSSANLSDGELSREEQKELIDEIGERLNHLLPPSP